jgi:taurine dioxygenase
MSAYETIQVRPVAGGCGAEIAGVDLSKPLGNQTFSEIHRAFLEHSVIFFRDQNLTPEDQEAFTLRFGPFGRTDYVKTLPDHPNIIAVIKEADERTAFNFGGVWHSDFSYQECPPMATILYGREVPPYGGDTMFANGYLAYEALSDGLKRTLEGMRAVHSARRSYGSKGSYAKKRLKSMDITADETGDAELDHPVIRTHPETGRKALFVNPVYTIRFAGWTEAESKPLLNFLFAHSQRPEFTCRFRWTKGALAMWDNRCLQHLALNDYDGFRREHHRTTVAGDRPV